MDCSSSRSHLEHLNLDPSGEFSDYACSESDATNFLEQCFGKPKEYDPLQQRPLASSGSSVDNCPFCGVRCCFGHVSLSFSLHKSKAHDLDIISL